MLDGTMVDVAIGVIVIFLVASLIASAIVEAIGGLFHRREKHLWDSLDLLLGNTSVDDDPNARRIVGELYKTPFITGLVKPSNRPYFDSAEGLAKRAVGEERLTKPRTRAEPRTAKSRVDADDVESINRRYYGPQAINARDFARGLIDVIRPGGDIDHALERADGLLAGVPDDDTATVAVDQLQGALAELDDVARATGSGDLSAAIESIRNAGDQIDVASLKAAVARINQTLTGLRDLSPDSIRAGIGLLPRDLRTKLGEVVESTTDDVAAIRRNVEDWFDRNMAAASMWYRRQTRWFLFAAGLGLAITLNVDAIHTTQTLYKDPSAREALVFTATEISAGECLSDEARDTAQQQLDCLREDLGDSIALPIGWHDQVDTTWQGWALRIPGWLLVATAVTLGAPFWFDLLRRPLDYRKKSQGSGGGA